MALVVVSGSSAVVTTSGTSGLGRCSRGGSRAGSATGSTRGSAGFVTASHEPSLQTGAGSAGRPCGGTGSSGVVCAADRHVE